MSETAALDPEQLAIYLNDHLAGSVAALELIEHLAKNFPDGELGTFFGTLHADVSADQDVLRDLLHTFGEKESVMRKTGAWILEKMGRMKFGIKKRDVDGIGLMQALEGLLLGITGKQLLWRALGAAAEKFPELRGLDYAQLERRALQQRDRVEAKRLIAAQKAFAGTPLPEHAP